MSESAMPSPSPIPPERSVAPPGYVAVAPGAQSSGQRSTVGVRRRHPAPRLLACGVGFAAMVVLALVLLASTGSRGSDALALAAARSSATPGYRMHMVIAMRLPTVPVPITASGDGVVDQRDHAASMSFAFDFSQVPQVAQKLGGSTMQMSMIMSRSALYIQLPPVLVGALGDKPWVKMDFTKLTGIKDLWSLGTNPAIGDPSQMLQYLRAASDSVTDEGKEQVDGVTATHYQADVSLDRISPRVPAADQPTIRRITAQLEQATHTHELPIEVWIDAHHLVRRMAMTLQMPLQGAVMNETMTADLSDYGPQPPPTLPPADQVRDLSSVVNAGG